MQQQLWEEVEGLQTKLKDALKKKSHFQGENTQKKRKMEHCTYCNLDIKKGSMPSHAKSARHIRAVVVFNFEVAPSENEDLKCLWCDKTFSHNKYLKSHNKTDKDHSFFLEVFQRRCRIGAAECAATRNPKPSTTEHEKSPPVEFQGSHGIAKKGKEETVLFRLNDSFRI